MSEQMDRDCAVSAPWASWQKRDGYETGDYFSRAGIVQIYRQQAGRPYPSLHFVWDGRLYSRSWNHAYTRRGCATLARRFVRDVADA